MEKIKIGVVFGGRSGEHEVSIRSAKSVIEEIDKDKYEVIPIAITKEGKWLNPVESLGLLPPETRQILMNDIGKFPRNAVVFSGDTTHQGLLKLETEIGEEKLEKLDAVFPVLHGTFGEDGTIQGLFEMADIPYVGCGVLASSTGMDKAFMKVLFRDAGLPICKYVWFLRSEWEADDAAAIAQIESKLVIRVSSNRQIWVRRSAFQKQATKFRCVPQSRSPPNTTAKSSSKNVWKCAKSNARCWATTNRRRVCLENI